MRKPINFIRKIRKELELSLADMSYFTGIPLERMDEIDRGKAKPTEEERERIGEVLRVDLFSDEYLGDKVFMKVTTDELSLPIAVANSTRELAEICGVTQANVQRGIWSSGKVKYPIYISVNIEEDEEDT